MPKKRISNIITKKNVLIILGVLLLALQANFLLTSFLPDYVPSVKPYASEKRKASHEFKKESDKISAALDAYYRSNGEYPEALPSSFSLDESLQPRFFYSYQIADVFDGGSVTQCGYIVSLRQDTTILGEASSIPIAFVSGIVPNDAVDLNSKCKEEMNLLVSRQKATILERLLY